MSNFKNNALVIFFFSFFSLIFIFSKEIFLFNEEMVLIVGFFFFLIFTYNVLSNFLFIELENRSQSIIQTFLNFYKLRSTIFIYYINALKNVYVIKNVLPIIYNDIHIFFSEISKFYNKENNVIFNHYQNIIKFIIKQEFALENKIFNLKIKNFIETFKINYVV